MLILTGPEIIKLAMKKSSLNQRDFSSLIGKSQSQVSKYITGNSEIPGEVNIHCMNIITTSEPDNESHTELLVKVMQLHGENNKALRKVLLDIIEAWLKK